MTSYEIIALYVITLIVFLVIDLTWLGVIAKDRYDKALKKFKVKKFSPQRIAAFYLIYIVGILAMVLVPAINDESLGRAMFGGLGFGFFTYATYGLTNWAVVDKWPTRITFEDIAWGTFLGWSVSTISYSLYFIIFG